MGVFRLLGSSSFFEAGLNCFEAGEKRTICSDGAGKKRTSAAIAVS